MATKYWYKINVTDGAGMLGYHGSSPYNEDELVRRIEAGRLVMLDDLVVSAKESENGVPRRWTDGSANHTGRIYVTAEQIVTLQPLKGDPLADHPPAVPVK